MKKIFALVLAIMMIATMAVVAYAEAADEGTIYVSELVANEDFAGLGNMSLQTKGDIDTPHGGCLGLGPVSPETSADAHITFTVEVATAGTYDVTVCYAAKQGEGQVRCADAIVNGGERIHLDIQNTGDWAVFADVTISVHLNAGENTVKLVNVEGFDNSTYKAINVLSCSWALTEADEVEGGNEGGETSSDSVTISGGWGSAYTPDYALEDKLEFDIEVLGGADNWNNVAIFFTNGPTTTEGYKEYAIIRADEFSWAVWDPFHESLDGNPIIYTSTLEDYDGDGDKWNDFRAIMADAHIDAVVEKTENGFKFTYTVTGKNGKSFVYGAETECNTENLHVKFACDNSTLTVTPVKEATGGNDDNVTGAPQTGVAVAILSVVAVLSGAYIVTKKH